MEVFERDSVFRDMNLALIPPDNKMNSYTDILIFNFKGSLNLEMLF